MVNISGIEFHNRLYIYLRVYFEIIIALQFEVSKRLIKQARTLQTKSGAKFKSNPQLRTRTDLRNKQITLPLPAGDETRMAALYDHILQAPIPTSFPLHSQRWLNIIVELPYDSTLPENCSGNYFLKTYFILTTIQSNLHRELIM